MKKMKTILITGGTDGMGKGLAIHYLKKGNRVIIIGSNLKKGQSFLEEAKRLKASERAVFLQADLSLISENNRIINEIKNNYPVLDVLILAAASQKFRETITITDDEFEFVFSLMYLSRYILSYNLIPILEKAVEPIIINIAAPGMKGNVNWNDLQFKKQYDSTKVKFHTSRLNDLLGVSFAKKEANRQTNRKIKYILFNPWAVKTNGALEIYESPIKNIFTKFVYFIIGKTVDEAIKPIIKLIDNQPNALLSAYKQGKDINLTMETYDEKSADRLDLLTQQLLQY